MNLSIYVTSQTDALVTTQPVEAEAAAEQDVRQSLYVDDDLDLTGTFSSSSEGVDLEKATNHGTTNSDNRIATSSNAILGRSDSTSSESTYHAGEKGLVNLVDHPALKPREGSESPGSPVSPTSPTSTIATLPAIHRPKSLASSKNKGTIISTSTTHLSLNSYTQTVTATTITRSGGKRTSTLAQRRVSQLLESQIDQKPRIKIQTIGGRPDLSEIVKKAVGAAEERDMVAVAACGPVELMRVTRNAVADSIKLVGGPSVTLHCEQFGWG